MHTKTETLELLRKTVAEKGREYRASYRYIDEDGTPACIAAQVLNEWNLLDRTIEDKPIDDLDLEDVITPGAIHMLTVAQLVQDNRRTWGEALDKAEEDFNLITDEGEFVDG
jgi:hypothetical protein